MEQKKIIRIAAAAGGTAVILGAFGAHAVKDHLTEEQVSVYETAVRYQFYHALALLGIAFLSDKADAKKIFYSVNFMTAGILIFCGSLYLLATSPLWAGSYLTWLGAITPLGGISLITGWLFLFLSVRRK